MNVPSSATDADLYRYAFADTAVGLTLVARSETGVAAILLGDDRAALVREARRALPADAVLREDEAVQPAADAVALLVADPDTVLPLPLDLRGSALELAVWDALRTIPAGETTTYGAIAKRLAGPAPAQEVGAACAANRIAVAVPCHRVLKADGSISGYRWGVRRKRRLLALEAAA